MYWLFLDDARELGTYPCKYEALDRAKAFTARSSEEAIRLIEQFGLPSFMALDHDLGGDDTTMVFLRWLASNYDFSTTPPPDFVVHSANPIGTLNIQAFMKSWKDIYNPP